MDKWKEMSYYVEPNERHYVDDCDSLFNKDCISYGLYENITYCCCMGVEDVYKEMWEVE